MPPELEAFNYDKVDGEKSVLANCELANTLPVMAEKRITLSTMQYIFLPQKYR